EELKIPMKWDKVQDRDYGNDICMLFLDRLATVLRLEKEHANVISVIAVLNLVPFHRDLQFFHGHGLKSIGLRERYPDACRAGDFRKFNAVNKLKLVYAFDDAGLAGGINIEYASEERCRYDGKARCQLHQFVS